MPMKKSISPSYLKPVFFICLLLTQPVLASWTLNPENSSLFYVTSKASAVSEVNTFGELSGSITDNGAAEVKISLGSVDTAIDIRNERMRDIVFQVSTYPLATVSLETDARLLDSLMPGENILRSYEISVSLHGAEQSMNIDVSTTKLAGGSIQVVLAKPLIINAATFGLSAAVEQLREIAGLPSINNNVVVDFTLQFDGD
jgi:hypothetical protein